MQRRGLSMQLRKDGRQKGQNPQNPERGPSANMSEWLAWPGTELMNLRGTRAKSIVPAHCTEYSLLCCIVLYCIILYRIVSYRIIHATQAIRQRGIWPWSRKKFAIATLWANCEGR